MQPSTTFLLLTIAAYVRAQCTKCPETVNGETFTYSCTFDGKHVCHYTGATAYSPGPFCGYYVTEPLTGTLDYGNSYGDCPSTETIIWEGCNACPTD